MERVVPLELMSAGEVGHVVQVDGDWETVHRLAEMGLRERSEIRMIQPGRPCIIAINEQRFSVRPEEGMEILVALNPS